MRDSVNPRSWTAKDFGQGLPHDQTANKKVIANYREALHRLRLRAPPLPDDLSALWDAFLEEFPDWWLQQHKRKLGNIGGTVFRDACQKIIDSLGKHCVRDPAKTGAPRSSKDGDANAFASWVRKCIAEIHGEDKASKRLRL